MKISEIQSDVFEAAWKKFRNYQREIHQPPEPPEMQHWYKVLIAMLSVIFTAAALMSAIRTMEVFSQISGHKIEGLLAVIVIEGVAGGITLFRVIDHYRREDQVPDASKIGWASMILVGVAIVLGFSTNIYSILLAQHLEILPMSYAVMILAGGIATVTLGILGHIIGVVYVLGEDAIREDKLDYEKAIEQYEKNILDKWQDRRTQKHWCQMVMNEWAQDDDGVPNLNMSAQSAQRAQSAQTGAQARAEAAQSFGFGGMHAQTGAQPKAQNGQILGSFGQSLDQLGDSKLETTVEIFRRFPAIGQMSQRDARDYLEAHGFSVSKGTISNASKILREENGTND